MMMYFMLLAGAHQGPRPEKRTYDAGEIIPSEQDLESLFGLNKFRRLSDRRGKKLFEQQEKEREQKRIEAEEKKETERQAKLSQQAEKDTQRQPSCPLFSSKK